MNQNAKFRTHLAAEMIHEAGSIMPLLKAHSMWRNRREGGHNFKLRWCFQHKSCSEATGDSHLLEIAHFPYTLAVQYTY